MKKTFKKIIKLLLIIFLGIPSCFIARILSPLKVFRVGSVYGQRIGHFAKDVGLYLAEKEFENNNKYIDLFYIRGKPSNNFFLKLIKRKLIVHPIFEIIYYANKFLPNYKKYEFETNLQKGLSTGDTKGLLKKTKINLEFTKEENKEAENFLIKVGCHKKFVCLNIRDKAYLEKYFPKRNYEYHNYRNSDINTYEKGIKYLLDKDYYIFRMGKIVEKSLDLKHRNFFDYANSKINNEFLDVWLMANCHFCISTSSGLDEISEIYRRPISIVNGLPLGYLYSWNPNCIWTPKTIVSKNKLKPLSLDELINTGLITGPNNLNEIPYMELLKKNNCTYIDNDPNEILENIIEMENRISKKTEYSIQSEFRQNIFWQKFRKFKGFHKFHNINQTKPIGRISDYYLNKNEDWFLK